MDKTDTISSKLTFNTKSSKKSSVNKVELNANKETKNDIKSEDISFSQLELLANQKKLIKRGEVEVSEEAVKRTKTKTSMSSLSSLSSQTKSEEYKKKKEKVVQKENKNDTSRREKSELLYKFNKINIKGKWSSLKLDMNCSLDEIRNEYTRVTNEIQTERSVAFFKRMLMLGVQGVEMLNTRFDPVGVDLDGWSESMGYSLENQDYDEVLAELYIKYKGSGQMSPETKLLFMIISSATMFTVTKKITKMDSSSMFTNILGSFMGQPQQANQQNNQMMQQMMSQMQQQSQAPIKQDFQIPNANDLRNGNDLRNANDLRNTNKVSESEDMGQSKLKGPTQPNANDIEDILKQMNNNKNEKELKDKKDIVSSDLFKSIPVTPKKRGKQPKKTITKVNH